MKLRKIEIYFKNIILGSENMVDVVAAILQNDKGELLIARRRKGKYLEGYWEFPGGKVEEGEKPEEGLIRELQEEMNIKIEVNEYIGENIHKYVGRDKIRLLAFKARIIQGDIKLVDHDQYMWIEAHKIEKMKLAPADIPLVPFLLEKNSML